MTDELQLRLCRFSPLCERYRSSNSTCAQATELRHKWLSVVGSRAMTTYGKQACHHLIEGLRGYPIAIVSGLAYEEAHKTALDAGLQRSLSPARLIGTCYPKANIDPREILNQEVHCSPVQTRPESNRLHFPAATASWLTHTLLVIE